MNTHKKLHTCEEYEMLVNDRLDGVISINDEAMLNEHLTDCSTCREYEIETIKFLDKVNKLPKEIQPRQDLWNKVTAGMNGSNVYSLNGEASAQTYETKHYFSRRYIISGIAAVIILCGLIILFSVLNKNNIDNNNNVLVMDVGSFWKVKTLNGTPSIEGKNVTQTDSLGVGQIITTDENSKAELTVAKIGRVIIQPGSQVQLVKSSGGEYRIKVLYGTIDADIAAAPRTFFVDMPSVTAVDLGCSYKLSVDSTGDGLLYVKQGKVSLESQNRESLVPAGKFCITKKDIGPGTPFRGDSSPKFKKALIDFDFGKCEQTCVNILLKNADKKDAVTLLNILPRVDENYKKEVYSRVAGFADPPRHIPDDSLKYLDIENLDEWIEKIQKDAMKDVEKNMQEIEKNMKHMELNMEGIPFGPEDEKYWENYGKQWEQWGEDFGKNFGKKFKIYKAPKDGDDTYQFDFQGDTLTEMPFDKEEFKMDMEELKKNMEELKHEFNSEEFKKGMEDMKHEFNSEEFKKEMEQMKKELKENMEQMKEDLKEMNKNLKIEIDSTGHSYKYKFKSKDSDKDKEDKDEPETPKVPENEDKDNNNK